MAWRRAARRLAVVLGVLAIAGAIGTWIYLSRYQPLANGIRFWVEHAEYVPLEADGYDLNGSLGSTLVRYESGDWFAIHGALINEGSFPIRVTGSPEMGRGNLLQEVRFESSIEAAGSADTFFDFEPFEPFTLDPGEHRLFGARYRFPSGSGCHRSDEDSVGWMTITDLEIGFEVFGVSRGATLPFENEVVALYPSC